MKIKIGETAVPSATSIAGSDLLVIADTTNLYAEVNVNETDVARVVPGQQARIVPAAFPTSHGRARLKPSPCRQCRCRARARAIW